MPPSDGGGGQLAVVEGGEGRGTIGVGVGVGYVEPAMGGGRQGYGHT